MSELTQDQIFERYAALRRQLRFVTIFGFLGAFVVPFVMRAVTFSMGIDVPGSVGFLLGFAILMLVVVWSLRTWRCPKCGVYLSSRPIFRWGTPNKCRGCGVPLERKA